MVPLGIIFCFKLLSAVLAGPSVDLWLSRCLYSLNLSDGNISLVRARRVFITTSLVMCVSGEARRTCSQGSGVSQGFLSSRQILHQTR